MSRGSLRKKVEKGMERLRESRVLELFPARATDPSPLSSPYRGGFLAAQRLGVGPYHVR